MVALPFICLFSSNNFEDGLLADVASMELYDPLYIAAPGGRPILAPGPAN